MQTTRFTEMAKSMKAGWKPEWKGQAFDALRGVMNRSLAAVETLEANASVWRIQGRLTAKGLEEEIRSFAKRHTVPDLKAAVETLEATRADIGRQRSTLALPKTDPADVAGTTLRGEMRAYLRQLPQGDRLAALLSENADDRLIQAALEVPPGMAGLTDQTRAEVHDNLVARKYQEPLAEIEQLETAALAAGAAIDTSLYQLRREANFSENQPGVFDQWMEAASKGQ